MNKLFLITLTIGLFFASNIRAESIYSDKQAGINASMSYGFEMEEIGIRGGINYFLKENMRLGGDFTYWLRKTRVRMDRTAMEINLYSHYIFLEHNDLMIYGTGNLGIHYERLSRNGFSESSREVGIALGVGGEYNLGPVSVFAEQKFLFYNKFSLGVRFYF